MLAHDHGQLFNASELARSLGTDHKTMRSYLDTLTATLVVRQLQPWHENLKKRQVKSPKVYVADTGLLHSLLGIDDQRELEGHPEVGASWEGFLIARLLATMNVGFDDAWFWATHSGAELDLLVGTGRKRVGFEFKRTTTPRVTASMKIALQDLSLTELVVIHAGDHSFSLGDRMRAVSCHRILDDL